MPAQAPAKKEPCRLEFFAFLLVNLYSIQNTISTAILKEAYGGHRRYVSSQEISCVCFGFLAWAKPIEGPSTQCRRIIGPKY